MTHLDMIPSAVSFFENRLCYNGQRCQRIPDTLAKLYGSKVHSLDLSYNELVSLRGLEGFPILRELVLDNNQLTDTLMFPHLPHLHTLSLNKNHINDIEFLVTKISLNFPALTYLSILGNKACPNQLSGLDNDDEDYQRYRYYVLHHLPNLKFLDSSRVLNVERAEAQRRGKLMKVVRPKSTMSDGDSTAVTSSANKWTATGSALFLGGGGSGRGDTRTTPSSSSSNYTPLPRKLRPPDDHRVDVLVEHDYIAKEPDELTIKKGDVIRDVICRKGGWWEGCLNNRKGVFPDNYVKLVGTDSVTLRSKTESNRIRKCRVVFSYRQAHEDELNLEVDDVVSIIGEEEEGWWRGTLNGKQGVFPSNFVEEIVGKSKNNYSSRESLNEVLEDIGASTKTPLLPPKPDKIFEVRYSYNAENEDELSLKEGDIITLISKDGQDPGWWRGELNGKVGVFPDNFVTPVSTSKVLPSSADNNVHTDKKTVKDTATVQQGTITGIKPSHIISQRKSFDAKENTRPSGAEPEATNRVQIPLANKKPAVPIKKSPSGSGSALTGGGLFSGLRKKIVDAVDGAAGSRTSASVKTDLNKSEEDDAQENAFDQVERNSMLQDVRATRAKAPRRRPPSVVAMKDPESPPSATLNGTADTIHPSSTSLLTTSGSIPELLSTSGSSTEGGGAGGGGGEETKGGKVREWEKHKAPWLEEMKLNQAKRTSTSPGPPEKKSSKSGEVEVEGSGVSGGVVAPTRKEPPLSPLRKDPPPPTTTTTTTTVDMSKSMPSLGSTRLKTPPPHHQHNNPTTDLPSPSSDKPTVLRHKVPPPVSAVRTSLPSNHNNTADNTPKPVKHSPSAPVVTASTAAAVKQPTLADRQQQSKMESGDATTVATSVVGVKQEMAPPADYAELLERVTRLERDSTSSRLAIEELRGKLQVETDLRRLLQAELDKVSQCVMQV